MSHGIALTDADRAGWLATLGRALADAPQGAVLTCSALKRIYREQLRAAAPGCASCSWRSSGPRPSAAWPRGPGRGSTCFPASLVANQFATLESPVGEAGVLAVDATAPLAQSVGAVKAWLVSP